MRIRRSLICLVAVAAALIALALWLGREKPTETSAAPSETNASPTGTAASVPLRTNFSVTQVTPSGPVSPPPLQNKEQQAREGLAEMNDEEILFYGRAIDQLG
jgi:hypothetical protein